VADSGRCEDELDRGILVDMSKSFEGSLIAIPASTGLGIAKVIFQSSYFSEMICLKLFRRKFTLDKQLDREDFKGQFDLHYTGLAPLKKCRWVVVARVPVSADEKALTLRTAGGEIWREDSHLGPASDSDLTTLPKQLTHGYKLIERYAERYPVFTSD
jgi:hypothetical protein